MSLRRRFTSVAAAGVAFQGGSAAVDSATIVSALILQLTGSVPLVGAVVTILRVGWLFPQLFVGFLAQRGSSSRRYYFFGAFGRAACIAAIACLLFYGAAWSPFSLGIAVMALWTIYAFVSGFVAVPYNDMVARAVPSDLRSRLLATRFFGGGLLALAVAASADNVLATATFPISYSVIFAIAAALMLVSSVAFVSMGDPPSATSEKQITTFVEYLREGRKVFRSDTQFRLFVFAQWCGGFVLMAMPFYVVHVSVVGFDLQRVAILLGAQTAGALISNFLWGWWGDRFGKSSLLRGISAGRIVPPTAIVVLTLVPSLCGDNDVALFAGIFFLLGALANGLTIAVIGFLMEISPDSLRPAYSGYFNALTAPAYLLPLVAGVVAEIVGLLPIFLVSAVAAAMQFLIVSKIERSQPSR